MTDLESATNLIDPALLLAFFENNPDAALFVDGESGQIMRVNDRCALLFGYHKYELKDQPVEMLMPEGLRDQHQKHRQKFADDPRPRSMGVGLKLEARRKNGSTFPVEINLAPVQTVNGTVVMVTIRRKENAVA